MQNNSPLQIEMVYANGTQIIRIGQSLTRGIDLSPLRTAIEVSLQQGKTRIALSLTKDSYLYSEILAHIVTYYKMISAQGGSLWLTQADEKILFILESIGLTDLIRVVPSEADLPRNK